MNQSVLNNFRRKFRSRSTLIGLDIGSQMVKVVQLRHSSQGWQLVNFRVENIPNTEKMNLTKDGDVGVESVLRRLIKEMGINGAEVAVSISGPSVIVKPIDVPWMTEDELRGHLELEVEQYLPYQRSDIYWDYYMLQSNNLRPLSEMTIYLVAARRETVDQRIDLVRGVGLCPVVVDIDSFAVANMYTWNYEDQGQAPVLLVNVGPSGFNMIAVGSPEGFYIRDTALGRECPQDISQEEMSREIAGEIQRTIDLRRSYEDQQSLQRIVLSGGYAHLPGLVDILSQQLQIPIQIVDPFKRLTIAEGILDGAVAEDVSALAGVAVGLALRCE